MSEWNDETRARLVEMCEASPERPTRIDIRAALARIAELEAQLKRVCSPRR